MTSGIVNSDTTSGKLEELRRRLAETHAPMGQGAIDKVHDKGRMTARERIELLLDAESFVELDALARHRSSNFGMAERKPVGDGVITGYGTIDGRSVCVFSQDVAVFGGSLGEVYGEKIRKIQELSLSTGRPLIGLIDGAGARIQEGVASLALYGDIFQRNVWASGVVPQISVIMGPAAGGHVYSPALTDFIVMVDKSSQMFVTGPDVIRAVTSEKVTMEDLGGATTHMSKSGVSHYTASDENDALDFVKELLGYLPSNNRAEAPRLPFTPPPGSIEENLLVSDVELDSLIPDSDNQPYDMHEVISRIVDYGVFLEIQPERATNILCGFGRVEGRSVGIVANQPTHFAGALDIDASEKAARFVRTCDAFNVPILTFVDVPGFLPGTEQEYDGIIRSGAKLLYAYGEATVGKITVITRKAYGGAYCVMGSKHLGADLNLAWPSAQIAVMGSSGAVGFVYRNQLREAREQGEDVLSLTKKLEEEYEGTLVNPYIAAARGYIDSVIPPSHTRGQISRGLRLLERKIVESPAKKHGNVPL